MPTGREAQQQLVLKRIHEIRERIDNVLPPGAVVPRHTDEGHFYGVPSGKVYPSVTGVISYVKDPSIQQFDMNEALRYVEKHLHECVTDGDLDYMKVMDVLYEAKKAPKGVLMDAADIGTQIHDRREKYYQAWIDTDVRPNIADFYDMDKDDVRLISAMRALSRFCDEQEYIPVRTEVLVYSDKYQLAGQLDDIGMVNTIIRPGGLNCQHNLWYEGMTTRCDKCNYKREWQFCLTDLKSSNQFKDSYYHQVALYHMMFVDLVGIKPQRSFILKTSKEDGRYKTEELTKMAQLVSGAKKIIAAAQAVESVKGLRKDSNAKETIVI
jgi:hypothetical protein